MNPAPPNQIDTPRLTLRWFTLADLDDITLVLGHPEVMRFSLSGPHSRAQCEKFINFCLQQYEKRGFGLFAVVLKESQKVIGYCGYYFPKIDGVEEIEIGYRLHPDYWGRGLATEAALAVKAHAFNELKLTRVISIIEAANVASIRVAEKIGMHHEKDSLFQDKIPARIYVVERKVSP